MEEVTKTYSNDEITVAWKPTLCIHSAICFKGLAQVFDPRRKPWIVLKNSTTDKIVEQVRRCPSGAISVHFPQNERAV